MSRGSSATSQKSVQDAKAELRRFLKKLDTIPIAVLEDEAGKLYAEIISEVPEDTGKLARSVRVAVAKDKKRPGLNASASALSPRGYNYAGIQHENRNFAHSKGKDHFISDPFRRCTQRIIRRIEEGLD